MRLLYPILIASAIISCAFCSNATEKRMVMDGNITSNPQESILAQTKGVNSNDSKWILVWNDEFDYKGLPDTSRWKFDIGGHGWGNNELQYYTNDTLNSLVKNGVLTITARKQQIGKNKYTSARLVTRGKTYFTYGKIEIRAKLPSGVGVWPAIWMLGKNITEVGWPKCGEIDIMEHVGYQKDSVFGTIHTEAYNHTKGTQKGQGIFIPNPYTKFHDFSINWTPESIEFVMDGVVYNQFVNEHKTSNEWPFDQPQFLIMNLAIGGGWGGRFGVDESLFPAVFEIDYVRIYKAIK